MEKLTLLPITFQELQKEHFALLLKWMHMPHIQQWYAANKKWSLEDISRCYDPSSLKQKAIKSFIISAAHTPIGYIQLYPVQNYPWEDQDLTALPASLAGVDFYIGEPSFLRKGYGSAALQQFLKDNVYPFYEACLTDPSINNIAAIGCYKKCGFEPHQIVWHQKQELLLLKKLRSNSLKTEEAAILIRPPYLTDALSLIDLIEQLGYALTHDNMLENLRLYQSHPHYQAFIAECHHKVVGCLAVHLLQALHSPIFMARITSLVVDQSMRRQGIASRLVQTAEAFAREKGCQVMELTMGKHRKDRGSHEFYQHMGYTLQHAKLYWRKELLA
ncbi:GNAT family N-acetyltransferase [Candidatus Protochlamydia phocaeensis]|uniref:GNAT family N-acetyltransferase n=1 Tax=Candidatus Protochlamydia phocaeensis TaxID=1414722 RepID=UPI000A5F1FB2|nr:GNAT family N-acetyltransferase [Candidatus Protochlamydia phocaeensis]